MLDDLENDIRQSPTTSVKFPNQKNLYQTRKDEIDLVRKTGTKSTRLTLLLKALYSIPPTSVESERAFSAAGLFVTKIRNRMGDDILDGLCFLRSYLRKLND